MNKPTQANLFVSAIKPKLLKDFNHNSLHKVKSDKTDAVNIASYILDTWMKLRQHSPYG